MTPELEPRDRTTEHADRPFPYGDDPAGRLHTRPSTIGILRGVDHLDPDGDVGSTACPVCGDETINGAGLFTCPDCDWAGRLE